MQLVNACLCFAHIIYVIYICVIFHLIRSHKFNSQAIGLILLGNVMVWDPTEEMLAVQK